MIEGTKCTSAKFAAKYLKRVAALTGAELVSDDSYWLKAGRSNFLVDSKLVRVISRHGKSTCYSVATIPDMLSAEVVASALLHLKNCPKLFKKWKNSLDTRSRRTGRCLEKHLSWPDET